MDIFPDTYDVLVRDNSISINSGANQATWHVTPQQARFLAKQLLLAADAVEGGKKLREEALAKLTPAEKKALGLK